MKRILILSLFASFSHFAFAATPDNSTMLVSDLPKNWKLVTKSETKIMKLREYIPTHEKAGQHSKIVAQVTVRKPSQSESEAFARYHEYKIQAFTRRGCEIKPMINRDFIKQKQHYEIFTYQCVKDNTSGVDLIYDADDHTIYDLMYEFSTRSLSKDQINEAIATLKNFKICSITDKQCLGTQGGNE